ncbi:hypothetical protein AIOL_004212 [Candidatus Rhodobacter oscarellae]|uniref:Uncharacterized protein n=1 Tax=Candidatus Rhodobacter oscarellae TaxID=1675527 RepID=A0A0J9E9C5_9RHOB|nr:hypothetical protein AIOL_004212 [Candidatus Rhodobacter lobularis]
MNGRPVQQKRDVRHRLKAAAFCLTWDFPRCPTRCDVKPGRYQALMKAGFRQRCKQFKDRPGLCIHVGREMHLVWAG